MAVKTTVFWKLYQSTSDFQNPGAWECFSIICTNNNCLKVYLEHNMILELSWIFYMFQHKWNTTVWWRSYCHYLEIMQGKCRQLVSCELWFWYCQFRFCFSLLTLAGDFGQMSLKVSHNTNLINVDGTKHWIIDGHFLN